MPILPFLWLAELFDQGTPVPTVNRLDARATVVNLTDVTAGTLTETG
jgi:hypothetical protein